MGIRNLLAINLKKWHQQGIVQPISVNLSIRLFQVDNLVVMIQNVLEKENLDPHLLELEITEFYD